MRALIAALATWRLTQFLVIDDGPFDLLFRLRAKVGRYDLDPADGYSPKTALGRLFECAHCMGKWVGLALALLVVFPTKVGDVILTALALAGAQSMIEEKRGCHEEALRVRRAAARMNHD